MKKLLAFALVLALMLTGAAFAESTAAVMKIDNIQMESDGQRYVIDGLTATGTIEGYSVPTMVLKAEGEGQNLLTMFWQIANGKVLCAVEGMDVAYSTPLEGDAAQTAGQLGIYLPMLLPELDKLALPPFPGVDIPMLDMRGVLSPYMTGADTFALSYEEVYAIVDQVMQEASQSGQNASQVQQAIGMLNMLKSMGMGVAIDGTFADNGDSQTVTANIHLVQNKQATEDAVALVTLETRANDTRVEIPGILTAELISDPAAATLNFKLDARSTMNLEFSLYPEDGLQKAAFDMTESGKQASLELGYGQLEGQDVVTLAAVDGESVYTCEIDSTMGADGIRTGTVALYAKEQGNETNITGDLTMFVGDSGIDVSAFRMPTTEKSIEEMQQDNLDEYAKPLETYIMSHIRPAA